MTDAEIDSYRQDLEVDIITRISEVKHLDLMRATDIYYRSHLSKLISQGFYGIDNLDYKYLANDLIENEPELFVNA